MFTSGFHLAASASAHFSPELMGVLSTTAFRSGGWLCHPETRGSLDVWNRAGLVFAATCGGAPSRWLTSTAFWCLDTHRTSASPVCRYQTLLPRIQWQRDVITLCCMKYETRETQREGGKTRETESYYLCSDNSLAEMEGLWWWAQCVSFWCQIGDLRIIYSWVYMSNAYLLPKLFVLLAAGLRGS